MSAANIPLDLKLIKALRLLTVLCESRFDRSSLFNVFDSVLSAFDLRLSRRSILAHAYQISAKIKLSLKMPWFICSYLSEFILASFEVSPVLYLSKDVFDTC